MEVFALVLWEYSQDGPGDWKVAPFGLSYGSVAWGTHVISEKDYARIFKERTPGSYEKDFDEESEEAASSLYFWISLYSLPPDTFLDYC